MTKNKYDTVDATPVKSFFVDMLTRDIELVDAILDLLDNCVDGILRVKGDYSDQTPTPYEDFEAEIKFDASSFSISDNCGGIPWDLHEYAFRMGKEAEHRDSDLPTVGVYGIGMKRAIFKIGRQCSISTKNEEDCYKVEITPEWIEQSDNWKLPVFPVSESPQPPEEDGTTIEIGELYQGIATRFGEDKEDFSRELTRKIETHYAFIIAKGFRVTVNGQRVEPNPTKLIFVEAEDEKGPAIRPYIYRAEVGGVNIFLSVGFTRPIPSQEEINDEQEEKRYSSMDAGWTIICNDRAVLYCDRTELTGWGEAGVPRYHTQFIAISGIVEFQCNDASKLPTTTTKRGIDASSSLYLQVKNKMRDGMKIFTNFTNQWKGKGNESQKYIDSGEPLALDEIKTKSSEKLRLNSVRSGLRGKQFMPKLPMPKPEPSSKRRISYTKDLEEIETVKEYLLGEQEGSPSRVGEECFDVILEEAR